MKADQLLCLEEASAQERATESVPAMLAAPRMAAAAPSIGTQRGEPSHHRT